MRRSSFEGQQNKGERIAFNHLKIIKNEQDNAFKSYFDGILLALAWYGLYKKELAKKVKFLAKVLCEDNYSSDILLYLAKKIVVMLFYGDYCRIYDVDISEIKNI